MHVLFFMSGLEQEHERIIGLLDGIGGWIWDPNDTCANVTIRLVNISMILSAEVRKSAGIFALHAFSLGMS